MTRVYIALGANLGEPLEQICAAVLQLSQQQPLEQIALSPLYWSEPVGPEGQPPYVNGVLAADTAMSPLDLLRYLQAVESQHGRVRNGQRWGARHLDLDVLLYGEQQLSSLELTVPHPHITERCFVLRPLSDIAPDLYIPGKGPLAELLTKLDCRTLIPIAAPEQLRPMMP